MSIIENFTAFLKWRKIEVKHFLLLAVYYIIWLMQTLSQWSTLTTICPYSSLTRSSSCAPLRHPQTPAGEGRGSPSWTRPGPAHSWARHSAPDTEWAQQSQVCIVFCLVRPCIFTAAVDRLDLNHSSPLEVGKYDFKKLRDNIFCWIRWSF